MENDFEKRLKDQLEKMEPDDTENLEEVFAPLTNMMKLVGNASLMEMGKTAREKMNKTIDAFVEEISGFSKSNPTEYYAKMVVKIQRAAETLHILQTVVTTSVVYGGAKITNSGTEPEDLMNTIIHLCRSLRWRRRLNKGLFFLSRVVRTRQKNRPSVWLAGFAK